MNLFIDGDILVYRVGFGFEDYDLLEHVEALDTTIRDIIEAFPDHKPILVLSNPAKTFRHDIAVTLPYKGNRTQPRPKFYNELRDYMLSEKDAQMSEAGFEADDHIGMNVNKKRGDIIATIDKDLFMIPAAGHYNFVKKELVKIKRPAYYFWKQMLVGDKADNIKGLWKIGEKTASAMLDNAPTKDMRFIVEQAYARQLDDKWFDRFHENGQLLWIKRHPDKTYNDYV